MGCINIGMVMLDGLYQYMLGNVGLAVSIYVRKCWLGCIDIGNEMLAGL